MPDRPPITGETIMVCAINLIAAGLIGCLLGWLS